MTESGYTDFLFVYGTLLRDANHPKSPILEGFGTYLNRATFWGKLYDVGTYPAVIASAQKRNKIFGELYKLNDPERAFNALDTYEGYFPTNNEESDYTRKEVTVYTLKEKKALKAWIYLYNKSINGFSPIPSGDYIEYLRSRSSE